MGKASVRRPVPLLIVLSALAIGTCAASAQNLDKKPGCATPTAEISNVQRPTGVLRADPNANDTASSRIANDVAGACQSFSNPDAARHVRLHISDNHIILTGTVPTEADAQVLVTVISNNADGRTVFNRLEVAQKEEGPPRTAGLHR